MIGEGERIDCCLAIRADRRDGSDVVDACDEPFDERRDEIALALVHAALEGDVPLLGVCTW